MAHYIAELIEAVETASTEDRASKMTQCADAILALWKHRHELPSGRRPFEDFEPIIRALESLDPTSNSARYFRLSDLETEKDTQDSEAKKWLDTAVGLDRVARILVGHCLASAAATASAKAKEYLALAEAAALTDTIDLRIIRVLSDESDSVTTQNLSERAKKVIEDKISRLEAFTEFAAVVALDLRQQLSREGEAASSS
jgi:hypothetical protein